MHIQIDGFYIMVLCRLTQKIVGGVKILGRGAQVKGCFSCQLCK